MAVINGTIGNDILPGTVEDDTIHDGNGGNDTINADAGNDEITVTGGSDTVNGQSGNDRLIVDWSSIASGIQTTGFNGTLAAGYSGGYTDFSTRNVTFSGIEHFTLIGNASADTVTTGDGDDVANLGMGNDVANLGGGTNSGDGGAGTDGIGYNQSALTNGFTHDLNSNLYTGAGAGFVNFEYFSNVTGGSGNDVFVSTDSASADTINGGGGDDSITSRNGSDTVSGGSGSDRLTVDYSSSAAAMQTSGFNGTLLAGYSGGYTDFSGRTVNFSGMEHFTFIGSAQGDNVTSGDGDDIANLGNGNDVANLGSGTNSGDGGAGTDGIGYNQSVLTSSITHDLNNNLYTGPGAGFINFEYFSGVTGGSGNDVFISTNSASADTINGGGGDDSITSRNGSDTVSGGSGTDRLTVDYSGSGAALRTTGISGSLVAGYSGGYTNFSDRTVNFSTIENFTFIGSALGDSVTSGDGDDIATLGDGDDVANLGAGINSGDGGAGTDGIGYNLSLTSADIVHDLTSNSMSGPGGGFINFEYFSNVTGGSGNDVFIGTNSSSNDIIDGGAGNDSITVRNGGDTVTGGSGNDRLTVDYSSSGAALQTSGFNGTLAAGYSGGYTNFSDRTVNFSTVENFTFIGSALGDSVTSGDGDDVATLGMGNDVANLAGGTNSGDGGAGTDGIGYNQSALTSSITHDLNSNLYTGAGAGFINFEYFSNVTGGSGNDVFVSTDSASADTINGGGGDDSITVYNGGDTVSGGNGTDRLIVDYSSSAASLQTTGVNGTLLAGYSGGYTNFSGRTVNFSGIENFTLIGSSLGDNATTGDGSDVLIGNGGNDTLNAGGGNDRLTGGLGNDTLNGGIGVDTAIYAAAGAGVTINLTGGTATGGDGSDTLSGIENIEGSAFADILTGNTDDNLIDGGAGDDVMAGGTGNDIYVADSIGDTVTEGAASGNDTIRAAFTIAALDINLENIELTGTGNFDGIGNASNNLITGNAGNNRLDGGAGDDVLTGGAGDDVYAVDSLGDVVNEGADAGTDLVESSVSFVLASNFENLTLTGSGNLNGTGTALANQITGNSGNNRIDGGAGNDVLAGGLGNDTYVVDSSGDVVTEGLNAGTDLVEASVSFVLGDNIENLTLTGGAALNGTGNAIGNRIIGTAGNNVLDGGAGADSLQGLGGNDSYIVDNVNDRVVETLSLTVGDTNDAGGIDTVFASVSYSIDTASNVRFVENLTLTGAANINATGNALANVITGNSGNNTLDGGAGVDVLAGGAGNDLYLLDGASETVTEGSGAGADTVRIAASYSLTANVENLELQGSANINGIGNGEANAITGTSGNNRLEGLGGNDVLNGGAGADTMLGGAGDDSYVIDNGSDRVFETVTNNAADTNDAGGIDTVSTSITINMNGYNGIRYVERAVLTGTASIGITGNALANHITGNTGNNQLDGGEGADILLGGRGNDIYIVDNLGDSISEAGGDGVDVVSSSVDWTLDLAFENLELTGSGNLNGTGSALANRLTGNAGNNILDGGGGTDTLIGGAGNDTYIFDSAGDRAFETVTATATDTNDAGGIDQIFSSFAVNLNQSNGMRFIENVTLTGTAAASVSGNDLANSITANSGANFLDGANGNDTILGLGGNDTMLGGSGADTLDGGAGRDRLTGGAGSDILTGGSEADTFVFATGDMGTSQVTADRITDWSGLAGGQGDRIDLSAIDANSANGSGTNEAFTFIGSGGFTNVAGQLRSEIIGGNTYLMADTNGDGMADLWLQLDGTVTVGAGDLAL